MEVRAYQSYVEDSSLELPLASLAPSTEYGDSESMEVIACYTDLAMFRKTNDNFCLTRSQTLMNGACCCDTCYRDVRFVQDFKYPSLDVFAALLESSD